MRLILKQRFLEEIYKERNKGTIIIISLLAMFAILLLGIYFLSFTTTGFKISKSQIHAMQTYYLSEAGINEAVWKIKNDNSWKECFTSSTDSCDCDDWSTSTIIDTSSLLEGSSYSISIKDSSCARGEVSVIANSSFNGDISKRVIKTKIFQPLASLTEDSAVFSGSPSGVINIRSSEIDIYSGNFFSSSDINIKKNSTVNIYDDPNTTAQEGLALAVKNVNLSSDSTLYSSSTCAKNSCEEHCPGYSSTTTSCPPSPIDVPAVDFDSTSSYSYKSRAQKAQDQNQCRVLCNGTICSNNCIFSEDDFSDLLKKVGNGGTLKLDYLANGSATSTYYVEGGITLKGGRSLDVDGVLIADDDVSVGESLCWDWDCGLDQLIVTDPGKGIPSGVLTKGGISFGSYLSTTTVKGLLYCLGDMDLTSLSNTFDVTGGMIASKFSLSSLLSPLEFHLDNDIIREGIWGGPVPLENKSSAYYSPVVTIEHWEEVY